ncbi:MAG TPA: DUF6794 domain-containing protein, partial [Cyclobacteriaceae bacterium]|nr:DUF6794 domain-containing protein [Cyclobacteriaceae bacterium]
VMRLHFGFGMWMRNNWGLWTNSELKKTLIDSGFVHPDDMSTAILKSYHRHLHGKPLKLAEEAARYRAYWQKSPAEGFSSDDLRLTRDSIWYHELLIQFSPGDTVVVGVYAAQKKLFQTYASGLRGLAIIKEYRNDRLWVKLIKLEQRKGHIPDRHVGDEFETSLGDCSFIPPKNWSATINKN